MTVQWPIIYLGFFSGSFTLWGPTIPIISIIPGFGRSEVILSHNLPTFNAWFAAFPPESADCLESRRQHRGTEPPKDAQDFLAGVQIRFHSKWFRFKVYVSLMVSNWGVKSGNPKKK